MALFDPSATTTTSLIYMQMLHKHGMHDWLTISETYRSPQLERTNKYVSINATLGMMYVCKYVFAPTPTTNIMHSPEAKPSDTFIVTNLFPFHLCRSRSRVWTSIQYSRALSGLPVLHSPGLLVACLIYETNNNNFPGKYAYAVSKNLHPKLTVPILFATHHQQPTNHSFLPKLRRVWHSWSRMQ